MVSDAGSPIISDPAHKLTHAVLNSGHELSSSSGISSVITALELAALPAIPFHFYGFLARDTKKKKDFAARINSQKGTHIFFESPKRVLATLEDLTKIFKDFSF